MLEIALEHLYDVYTRRSSRRSVALPMAATIVSCKQRIRVSHPPVCLLCYMTSLVRARLAFWTESYQSDICRYRAMPLLPIHSVVNWQLFTIYRNRAREISMNFSNSIHELSVNLGISTKTHHEVDRVFFT